MKKKLMLAGSCLLVGMLSCSLLAAAKRVRGEYPKARSADTVAAASKDAEPRPSAKAEERLATSSAPERKRRRTRKAAARDDGARAEAPRKARSRRSRKQAEKPADAMD